MRRDDKLLAKWKAIAGSSWPGPWQPENTAGLFNRFRPDGKGLEEIFDGLQFGEEVLARVLEIFKATADDFAPKDWYFVIKNPPVVSRRTAVGLGRQHLEKMTRIVESQKDPELLELLKDARVVVASGWAPDHVRLTYNRAGGMLEDTVALFLVSLERKRPDVLLLKDAIVSMANEPFLRDYCVWPVYARKSTVEEPFRPFMEMWKRAIKPVVAPDGVVTVYVQNLKAKA